MDFKGWIESKKSSVIVVAIIITMVLGTTVISSTVTASAATSDYYKVKVGNKVVAKVATRAEANTIVNKVKNHYTSKDAKVISVKTEPALTVEPAEYEKYGKKPSFDTDVKKVANTILTGSDKLKNITVKDGDTVWSIAQENNLSVYKLLKDNHMKEEDTIKAGDVLKCMDKEPLVKVTVVQEEIKDVVVPHDSKEVEKADMYEDESEVKTEGEDGIKAVKAQVTTVDGKQVAQKELESKVKKAPVTEVVYKGTKERGTEDNSVSQSSSRRASSRRSSRRSYSRSTSSYSVPASGNGSSVAAYASQFAGVTPYVLGASDLQNGADCAGFIYRVFTNCGVSVPYLGPSGWAGYGRGVSYSEARPGDVLVYPGHVSMYIGGGREVHALNPSMGTRITNVGFGGNLLAVRRVL